jgi:flagellar protein FliS
MSPMQQRARAMTAYQTAALTVTPARAIVMLYDGAVQRLQQAGRAITEGRIEERYRLVGKAHAIVHGLQCQLDFAAGGEVALLLDRYYAYLLHRMTQINVRNDPAICDEVIARLRDMRASWAAIAETGNAAPAPPPVQADHRPIVQLG